MGDREIQAGRLLLELPLPVAQLLRRGANAKSAVDRHHLFYFAGEAALKLAAAARAGVWLSHCLEPGSRAARRIETLVLPSVGHWFAVLRELSFALSQRAESSLLPLASLDGELRRQRVDWKGADAFFDAATAAGSVSHQIAQQAKSSGTLGFFEFLVAYRNEVMAHGSLRGASFYETMADALERALAEVLASPAWLGGMELAVARVGLEQGPRPAIAWQVLHGFGGLLRRAQPDVQGVSLDSSCRPGELYCLGPGARVPLHPLLVFREDDLGREKVGFLNRTVQREGGAGQVTRRVDFLDYVSGERLQEIDARAEVQRLFSRLRGEEVGESAVEASLALETSEAPDRTVEAAAPAAAVLGDFELEGELGRGGMGVVYRARQRSLNRRVALKVLPPDLAADPVTLARFRREISALARCDHPNVVRILATGLDGDRWWYAMELVDGVDLAVVFEVLSSWLGRGARLTAEHFQAAVSSSVGLRASRSEASTEARASALPELPRLEPPPAPDLGEGGEDFDRWLAQLMAGACRGVEHLHELGIVHRDLKPGNLMLTADGSRMVVTDLGLAQLREASLQLTRTAAGLLGTLRYMAPEQLHGRLLEIDHRADVYGLGATLYELACLKPVYEGATEQELLRRKVEEEPPAPRKVRPELPEDLATILETALRRRPTERYASAGQLADDLEAFARHEPIRARPASRFYHLRLFVERNRTLVRFAAAAAILFVTSLSVFGIWNLRERRQSQQNLQLAERNLGQAFKSKALSLAAAGALGLEDPIAASLFAAKALTFAPTSPELRGALALALATSPQPVWRLAPDVRPVTRATVDPGRSRLAILHADGKIAILDLHAEGKPPIVLSASRNGLGVEVSDEGYQVSEAVDLPVFTFDHSGRYLAFGDGALGWFTSTLQIANLKANHLGLVTPTALESVWEGDCSVFTADSKELLVVDSQLVLHRIDPLTGSEVRSEDLPFPPEWSSRESNARQLSVSCGATPSGILLLRKELGSNYVSEILSLDSATTSVSRVAIPSDIHSIERQGLGLLGHDERGRPRWLNPAGEWRTLPGPCDEAASVFDSLPSGELLFRCGLDQVRLVGPDDGIRQTWTFRGGAPAWAFFQSSNAAVFVFEDSRIALGSFATGHTRDLVKGSSPGFDWIEASGDGGGVVAISREGTFYYLDTHSGRLEQRRRHFSVSSNFITGRPVGAGHLLVSGGYGTWLYQTDEDSVLQIDLARNWSELAIPLHGGREFAGRRNDRLCVIDPTRPSSGRCSQESGLTSASGLQDGSLFVASSGRTLTVFDSGLKVLWNVDLGDRIEFLSLIQGRALAVVLTTRGVFEVDLQRRTVHAALSGRAFFCSADAQGNAYVISSYFVEPSLRQLDGVVATTLRLSSKRSRNPHFKFSPRGSFVAGTSEGVTTIWRASDGRSVGRLLGSNFSTSGQAFLSEDELLTATEGGELLRHHLPRQSWAPEALSGEPLVAPPTFARDGSRAVAVDLSGGVVVFEGPLAIAGPRAYHLTGGARGAIVTPDGHWAYVALLSGGVEKWSLKERTRRSSFQCGARSRSANSVNLATSPDGTVLAAVWRGFANSDELCLVKGVGENSEAQLREVDNGMTPTLFSADSKVLVLSSYDDKTEFVEVATGKIRHKGDYWLRDGAVTRDGRGIFLAHSDGHYVLAEISLSDPAHVELRDLESTIGRNSLASAQTRIAFIDDGRLVLVATGDGEFVILDEGATRVLARLPLGFRASGVQYLGDLDLFVASAPERVFVMDGGLLRRALTESPESLLGTLEREHRVRLRGFELAAIE